MRKNHCTSLGEEKCHESKISQVLAEVWSWVTSIDFIAYLGVRQEDTLVDDQIVFENLNICQIYHKIQLNKYILRVFEMYVQGSKDYISTLLPSVNFEIYIVKHWDHKLISVMILILCYKSLKKKQVCLIYV